jgi:glycosyltransferase involved in cell wall biosynthesis
MKNTTISIIVPVYNAENYLHDCLNSIRSQTFTDFEVLLIDDGSDDHSLSILQEFQTADSRFQVHHQENRGVSSARNLGLQNAIGEFVCFVDADDKIAPTYLEDLYLAMGDQVDSSMGGFRRIDLLSNEEWEVVPQRKIETLEENLLGFYAANHKDWQRYMVNRLFRRSIIQTNNLRFKEDIYYKEDGLFLVQYLCASNGMVGCVDKVLYYYYRNATGAMSKTWHAFDEKIITNLVAHRLMIDEIRRKDVSEVVLSKAIGQAKAACNWILQMLWNSKVYNISYIVRIERIMISILGFRDYFLWRTIQLGKLLK